MHLVCTALYIKCYSEYKLFDTVFCVGFIFSSYQLSASRLKSHITQRKTLVTAVCLAIDMINPVYKQWSCVVLMQTNSINSI